MSFYLPDDSDETIEEPNFPPSDQGGSSDEEEQKKGRSQSDNLQDTNRLREQLADKLGGSKEAGEAAGEAAGQGAGEGAGAAAGEGAGTAAGEGAAAAAEGAGAAGAVGAGEGVAAGAGTGAAVGTGAGTAAGAGAGAAAGTGAGAAAGTVGGGAVGALGGPLAPVTVPGAAVLGGSATAAASTAASNDTGRKGLIWGSIGGCGCLTLFFLSPLLFFFMFDSRPGQAAGEDANTNSNVLTISKTAAPNLIPKNSSNAVVNYTITVKNNSDKTASNVVVTDGFSSSPEGASSFAASLTGYEASYTIGNLAPGQTNTKTFSVTVTHTDFDPGWILTNQAAVAGAVDGKNETSNTTTTVVIGNPPAVPPTGCPMKGNITTPYGTNIPGYVRQADGSILPHDGIDIGDGVKDNAPVYATITGTLRYANYYSTSNGELTQRIIISNGIYQVEYFHLSESGKAPEGSVVIGQKIGNEDETGFTQGEHLHYEVRVNGSRVDPSQFLGAQLNYTQPANNDFTGYQEPTPWGVCSNLPQAPSSTPAPAPTTGSEYFIFSDAGDKSWTQAEKDMVSQAILTPVNSATWKSLVFSAGKVTLQRSSVDASCPDICSGYAIGSDTLILRDKFFSLTAQGRVFVITHELTHLLQQRNPQVAIDFNNSSAFTEYQSKGVIRSYPLCDGTTCQTDLSPYNENFAEMAGNYVADRDGYSVDFPNEYPEQFKFARDKLFGGTNF